MFVIYLNKIQSHLAEIVYVCQIFHLKKYLRNQSQYVETEAIELCTVFVIFIPYV